MECKLIVMEPQNGSRNFDSKEDELLTDIVKKCGTDSWTTVAAALGTRNARQCRNRWTQFLAPGVNKAPWTQEEDDVLKKQYEELGSRWSVMRSFFPGRTDLSIKNRFNFLARNRADIRELKMKYIAEHRGEDSDREPARGARHDARGPVTVDAMFEALPFYMKRCVLLEAVLHEHRIQVPPEGVCDEKQWIHAERLLANEDVGDHDQLPPIPEPGERDKE